MKKTTVLIILLFNSNLAIAQHNLSNNKEYFDFLFRYYTNSTLFDENNPGSIGDNVSWYMMGLNNLYEQTGDKAYLIQLIHLSSNAIRVRFDVKNNFATGWNAKWTLGIDDGGKERTYYNTLLTIPMAKFIYLIRGNSVLYNTNLPINNIGVIGTDFNNLLPQYSNMSSIYTYGDYADWLGARVEETMHYLNENYWDSNNGHLKWQGKDTVAELNFQSCFATLYLWMYKINHTFGPMSLSHSYLGDKLNLLSNRFKGVNAIWCDSLNIFDVFETSINNGKDVFQWGHYGWKNYGCSSFLKEDIAHGAMDLFFPLADYETGQEFFTDVTFLEKAHNTFTENIWVSPYKFYNNVYGGDYDMAAQNINNACDTSIKVYANGSLNYFYHEILNWMPLYKFGNNNTELYENLMLHTYNLKKNIFPSFADAGCRNTAYLSAQGMRGLSEVVKAQWERECVNLNLYNRDMVYDQDFSVKNRLIVNPYTNDTIHTPSSQSFADPIIYTPTFTIEEGVTVNMVAGESIDFYPGTSVVAGGNLSAKIQASDCTDGKSMSQSSANTPHYLSQNKANNIITASIQKAQEEEAPLAAGVKATESISKTKEILIVPNPANNQISILHAETGAYVTLFDASGHVVLQDQLNTNNTLDISMLNKGLYFVQLQEKSAIKMQRFIKQ